MKKLLKFGSLLSLASVLVLTGCSCKVKEEKYSANADAMGDSDMLKLDNIYVDFSATYTRTTKVNEEVVNEAMAEETTAESVVVSEENAGSEN